MTSVTNTDVIEKSYFNAILREYFQLGQFQRGIQFTQEMERFIRLAGLRVRQLVT